MNKSQLPLKTVLKIGNLYVSRMTESDLTEFLKATAPKIPFNGTLWKKQEHTASFEVSFPIRFVKDVYNSSIWPEEAALQSFTFPYANFRLGTSPQQTAEEF
ncbi:hypothetical protein JTB14_022938 [Gonioctena quinquepunctata]|nr:hypothetical protein JTB14_022938 [Gonioctena quinquepunctata]